MARKKKTTKKKTAKSPKPRRAPKKRAGTTGRKKATGSREDKPAKKAPRQLKKRTAPAADVLPKPNPTVDEIRDRAYEIYLRRGGTPGDPAADWFQAERELREELAQKRHQP